MTGSSEDQGEVCARTKRSEHLVIRPLFQLVLSDSCSSRLPSFQSCEISNKVMP